MSDYVFPYWDDCDYWHDRHKKNNKTIDDDDLPNTVED
jgi:hypothetical protein